MPLAGLCVDATAAQAVGGPCRAPERRRFVPPLSAMAIEMERKSGVSDPGSAPRT